MKESKSKIYQPGLIDSGSLVASLVSYLDDSQKMLEGVGHDIIVGIPVSVAIAYMSTEEDVDDLAAKLKTCIRGDARKWKGVPLTFSAVLVTMEPEREE